MEIWVWALIGAAFGGAIGWSLHMLYLQRQTEAAKPAPVDPATLTDEGARATALERDPLAGLRAHAVRGRGHP